MSEVIEDIIEAFPDFLTDDPINGGDLVEFIAGMVRRYEQGRPRARRYNIIVTRAAGVRRDDLHELDQDVAGIYTHHNRNEEEALDQFHCTTPIKVLDDFHIEVKLT